MSALREAIINQKNAGQKAMGIFVTSGYPNKADTVDILKAIAENGADFLELGMPFSDPLAEGTPIQKSSERALGNGLKMSDTLSFAKTYSEQSNVPILLMGYINPIMRFGMSNFCETARSCGVKGLIIPDLPPGESEALSTLCKAHQLDLIHLIAPNTADDRVKAIDELSSGFVYAVSITGLTGSALNSENSPEAYLRASAAKVVENPLMVGFGINSHEKAMRMSKDVDGFIVGSAVIKKIESLWENEDLSKEERLNELGKFVHDLKFGSTKENN